MSPSFLRACVLLAAGASSAVSQLVSCPSNTSACPSSAKCCTHSLYGAEGCDFGKGCCAPGPPKEPSTTLPNCLIIGDSVSLGYTPQVAGLMKGSCLVQHAPWVGGGSANNAANGMQNLNQCQWLRTAKRPDLSVAWDVILFNFGLHDLEKNTDSLLAIYEAEIENITSVLLGSGAKHIQYALTTPFMPDTLKGNNVVPMLNERARKVMDKHGVPVLDLNAAVHQHCGQEYNTCSLCDNETKYHPGIFCGYHYTSEGYHVLAKAVADSFEKILKPSLGQGRKNILI